MSYINKQTTIYEGDVYITGSQDPSIYGIGNLNIDGNFNINNKFSISDTSNSVNSTTASFTVYGGFSINGSQNATSYTSGGGLTIAGGLAIGQDTYIGGNFSANSSTVPNSVFTNISSGTINANSSTVPNSVFTNISSGTISTINITTSNIKVTGTTTVSTPINASDAATKAYVDGIVNTYYNVSVGTTTANTSTSTSGTLVQDMSFVTSAPGAYSILFNSDYNIPAAYNTIGFSTLTASTDLNLIYNDIIALPGTRTHAIAFGGGETILPGVYALTGAITIAGTLTLNGQGNSNSIFIIRGTAAFNTATFVTVILSNGTQARNVYWVAQDAIGLGASTTIAGLFLANTGAIAVGANCVLSGARLFAKTGAIAFGPGSLLHPIGTSTFNLRTLENFVIFTGSGAIANTGISTYTGDIATNLGAITGFQTATVNGTIYPAGSSSTVVQVFHTVVFGLYVNNVLIAFSDRKKDGTSTTVSLQGVAIVMNGDTVEVRYILDSQISNNRVVNINNRILTTFKIN
jgi:hypothetical protein